MVEHLPECNHPRMSVPHKCKDDVADCPFCDCRKLRACEQRKDAEYAALREVAESLAVGNDVDELIRLAKEADRLHFTAGVQAAHEAVAATEAANTSEGAYVFRARALAAIDGILKGEQA